VQAAGLRGHAHELEEADQRDEEGQAHRAQGHRVDEGGVLEAVVGAAAEEQAVDAVDQGAEGREQGDEPEGPPGGAGGGVGGGGFDRHLVVIP
jgi:hypothetical protein